MEGLKMGKRIKEESRLTLRAINALIEGGAITHYFDDFGVHAIFNPKKIHLSHKMAGAIGEGLYNLFKKMKIEKHFIGIQTNQTYSESVVVEDIIDKIEIFYNEDKRKLVRRVFLNDVRFDREFSPEFGNKFYKERSKIVLVGISLVNLINSIDVCMRAGANISNVFLMLHNHKEFRNFLEKCKEDWCLANTDFHLFLPLEDVFANYFHQKMM